MNSVDRQQAKIQRQIDHLKHLDQIFNQRRTILFVVGLVAILFSVFEVLPQIMSGSAVVVFVIYGFIVSKHRHIRRTLALFESRKKVALRQKAMLQLDWAHIPTPATVSVSLIGRPDLAYLTDLNIIGDQSLYRLINQCVSKSGAEALLRLFTDQVTDAQIVKRARIVEELKALRQMRFSYLTRIGAQSTPIDGQALAAIFNESLSGLKSNWQVVWILGFQATMLGCLVYANLFHGSPFFMIPIGLWLFENFRLRGLVKTRSAYGWSLAAEARLDSFRGAVEVLEKYSGTAKPQISELLQAFAKDTSASARIRQLDQVSGALGIRQNFVIHGLVHFLLPWDILWTLRLDHLRQKMKNDLVRWTEALAEFEAFLSLAMYADANPNSIPAILDSEAPSVAAIEAVDLKHPLIVLTKAVGNPVKLDTSEKCILLTGSNMSGKSTFLRAVGISLVMAKAGAPVNAKKFRFRNVTLLTSLSGADSLQEGLSSFYAEVTRLSFMLKLAQSGQPLVFLVDEIYRGTNNRERLIGSRAFIREMIQTGAKGIVSSHDVELSNLEEQGLGLVNYHFRESIQAGIMTFSFKKEKGPCLTTNALQVMQANGLPVK